MQNDMYISKLANAIISNLNNKSGNAIFVKHYNTLNITKSDVGKSLNENKRIKLLFYEYSDISFKKAYEPFLEWIKEIYDEIFSYKYSVEEFVAKSKVYPLQAEVFISYLNSGICRRNETTLLSEYRYEEKRMLESIINIYTFIAEEVPLVIVLNKLHLAGHSSIRFVSEFVIKCESKRIAVLGTFNEVFPINSYVQPIWNEFMIKIDNHNMVFDWGAMYIQRSTDITINNNQKTYDVDELIITVNNMIHTYAIAQAFDYLTDIYEKMEKDKISTTYEQKMKIMALYCYASIFDENYNNALLIRDTIDRTVKKDDYRMQYYSNFLFALIKAKLNQSNISELAAKECKKLAKLLKDPFLLFESEYLHYLSLYNGWQDIFLCEHNISCDGKFIEKLKRYKFYNTLAYIYIYGFENDIESIEKTIREKCELVYFKKGLDIGQKNDNRNFLLSAYMKNIVLYSEKGYHEYVEELYMRRIEIMKQENNIQREGNMFNGLGYNCAISERYIQANDYLNSALKIMYDKRLSEQVAESLYNMAFNCILINDYETTLEYLLTIVKVVDNIHLQSIKMCNRSKLYGMIAYCNFYLGVDYNCYLYLSKIERILYHLLYPTGEPDYHLWDDDLFLYHLVKGLIYKRDLFYDKAEESFKKADFHQQRSQGIMFFSYPILTMELSDLYIQMGRTKEAEDMVETCVSWCNKKGYIGRANMVNEYGNDKIIKHKAINLKLRDVTLEEILRLSEQEGVEKELRARKKDIIFLSSWQEMLNNDEKSIDELIPSSMAIVQNNFNLDGVLYFKIENGKLINIYSTENIIKSEKDKNTIVKFFREHNGEFVVNRTEKLFFEYKDILDLFGINNVASLIGVPLAEDSHTNSILLGYINLHRNFTANSTLLYKDNLTIVKFIFAQFVEALERTKNRQKIMCMNEKLQEIASTDNLTGLFNRQGFYDILEDEYEKNKDKKINTVMYLDLDNFKYYNDNFGHDVGDKILVLFADIFKKCVGKNGFVVRYGGDEFIAVLAGKDSECGKEIASEIYIELQNQYETKFQKELQLTCKIPINKRISCSIGIASFEKYNFDNISNALKQADNALYEIKNNKKGNYMIWNEESETK